MGIFVNEEKLIQDIKSVFSDEYRHNWLDALKKRDEAECQINNLQKALNQAEQEIEKLHNELEVNEKALEEAKKKVQAAGDLWVSAKKDLEVKTKEAEESQKIAEDLIASIRALTSGFCNKENVEFFALKTYRGWKYICHNGNEYKNPQYLKEVNISWKQGDTVKCVTK